MSEFPCIYASNLCMNRVLEHEFASGEPLKKETLTNTGKLGLRLLEDLTALAAGGSVCAKLKKIKCGY